jgi:S1-C subfamily serine protease
MNNPQLTPMRNRFTSVTIVCAIATITTISFNGMLPSTAVAQQQRVNSNTSSSQSANSSSANLLPLKTIFKQVENSVVQITNKIPTATANPINPQTSNATVLGSGFVYDEQGHIITDNHVVADAKIVHVTFIDGNRYPAKVSELVRTYSAA